jgi:hypothetical protein
MGGDRKNAYMILVGKRERREQLRRTRLKWEDNIKVYVKNIGYGQMAVSC